ncbi:MAG: hypothetical protein WBW74_00735 [Xanthobacteraceae bacterium]
MLQRLYDSGISAEIVWGRHGRFSLQLGDAPNGYRARGVVSRWEEAPLGCDQVSPADAERLRRTALVKPIMARSKRAD